MAPMEPVVGSRLIILDVAKSFSGKSDGFGVDSIPKLTAESAQNWVRRKECVVGEQDGRTPRPKASISRLKKEKGK